MHICVCIYIYICILVFMYTYIYTYIYIFANKHIIHICPYIIIIYIYMSIYIYICIYIHMLHGLLWDRRNMLKLLGIGTASVSLLPPFESRGQETAPRYDLTATSNCLSAAFRIEGWTLTPEDRVGIAIRISDHESATKNQ